MSARRHGEPCLESIRAGSGRGTAWRFQTGVRGLIVVVACCGALSWSARSLWESQHPAITAARGLQSADPAQRTRATRELASAGETDPIRAIPPLIDALRDPEAEVRVATIEALGMIGGKAARGRPAGDAVGAAVAGLIRSLKDPEPAVRIASMYALVRIAYGRGPAGPIDPKVIVDALASMLGDRDDGVRAAAMDALTIFGPVGLAEPPAALIAALKDSSANHRANAVKALASFRCSLDPWLPFLLRSLEHEDREVRRACWAVFARTGPPAFSAEAVPRLIAALGNPARIVRTRAARALEPHVRDPRCAVAIPALLALLKEPIARDPGRPEPPFPDFPVEFNEQDPAMPAARLLAQLAPGTASAGEVVAALTEIVRSSEPFQRSWAFEALEKLGPAAEQAVPALIQILREAVGRKNDVYAFEGELAARVLAKIAPGTKSAGEVIAGLTEIVRSGHSSQWQWAADALSEFGPAAESAIPALIQALHQAVAEKEKRPSYGFSVARALGRVAPGTRSADAALAAVTEALHSPSEARLGAIYALSAFGSKASGTIPQLRAWQNGTDYSLRLAAISALKAIEGSESEEPDRSGGSPMPTVSRSRTEDHERPAPE